MKPSLLPFLALSFTTAFAARCTRNPATHYFTLGALLGTVVSDGPVYQNLSSTPYSVSSRTVLRSYRRSFRPTNPITLSQNILVLDTPAARLLIDAGSANVPIPTVRDAGKLVANLAAAGISPASIDAVLLTHGHLDHVAGLVTATGEATFPKAAVYIDRAEHEFWSANDVPNLSPKVPQSTVDFIAGSYKRSIAPYKSRLSLVAKGGAPLPGVRFIAAPGHTPGHVAIEITSKGERLVVVGDAWVSRPDQLQHPKWSFFIESDSADAFKSRVDLLKMVAKRRDLVLVYHEQFPGLGYVSRNRGSFDWIPAATELLGAAVATSC